MHTGMERPRAGRRGFRGPQPLLEGPSTSTWPLLYATPPMHGCLTTDMLDTASLQDRDHNRVQEPKHSRFRTTASWPPQLPSGRPRPLDESLPEATHTVDCGDRARYHRSTQVRHRSQRGSVPGTWSGWETVFEHDPLAVHGLARAPVRASNDEASSAPD